MHVYITSLEKALQVVFFYINLCKVVLFNDRNALWLLWLSIIKFILCLDQLVDFNLVHLKWERQENQEEEIIKKEDKEQKEDNKLKVLVQNIGYFLSGQCHWYAFSFYSINR